MKNVYSLLVRAAILVLALPSVSGAIEPLPIDVPDLPIISVPEPSTLILLAGGVGASFWARRRFRR